MKRKKIPAGIVTAGLNKYSHLRLPIRVIHGRDAVEHLSLPCFKILLIEDGAGFFTVNGIRRIVAFPSALFLNDRESAEFEGAVALRALLFLPEVVNGVLSVRSIREDRRDGLGLSGILDLFWAKPFSGSGRRPAEIPLTPAAARALKDAFGRVETELTAQESSYWPCRARSHLIELLFLTGWLYLDRGEIPSMPDPDSEVAPVLLFLHTHYGEKITVDALARQFGTNRNSLRTTFTRATGKSPGLYLRELRLSIARSLLADTKLPVATVLEKTGFSDATHFGRAFRKRFGVTPAAFRKNTPTASRNA